MKKLSCAKNKYINSFLTNEGDKKIPKINEKSKKGDHRHHRCLLGMANQESERERRKAAITKK